MVTMLGGKIREQRERLGWSQEELGEKVGLESPKARISNYETGQRNPSSIMIRDIADAMYLTPAELVGIVPDKVQEILKRGGQPELKNEHEFYYVGGLFAAALVNLEPRPSKKYQVEYAQPVNLCPGKKLKDRIAKQLFTYHSKDISLESPTRNKLTAAFMAWEPETKDLTEFGTNNLFLDYSKGYFLNIKYPVV